MNTCSRFIRGYPHLLIPAAVLVVLEVASALTPGYEYFIDELYYVACAKRLALGYVDHPPLAPLLLRLSGSVLGYSVLALRIIPALAGAGFVILTGLLAEQMGGKRTAQTLAAVTALASPLILTIFSFFSVNSLELLLWTGAAFALVRIVNTDDHRLWLVFGVVAGLALMTKHTFILFGGATAAALLLSPQRRHLASPWPWLAVLIALLVLAPNILWQIQNGFPSIEFYRNATINKNIPTPPLEVFIGQVMAMNPLAFPVWAIGAWFLLVDRSGCRYRLLGFLFLILVGALIASQSSRPDRVAGIYPAAIAGGCVMIERLLSPGPRWIPMAVGVLLAASAVALAPLAVPLLPPQDATEYAASIGVVKPIERGEGKATVLPQLLADRIGWELFAREMAAAFHALPPGEREQTSLFAMDYGHAGMLELRQEELGLPEVFCPHNTYWMWGKQRSLRQAILALTFDRRGLREVFNDVRHVRQIRTPLTMPWRADVPVYLAREPRVDLKQAWEQAKHYE